VREFPEGAWIEHVSLDVLYKRDNGICQLCLKPCSRRQASRDHRIPIARGGEHSYANVQLAHKLCNSHKGDKLEEEMVIPVPPKLGRKGRTTLS